MIAELFLCYVVSNHNLYKHEITSFRVHNLSYVYMSTNLELAIMGTINNCFPGFIIENPVNLSF